VHQPAGESAPPYEALFDEIVRDGRRRAPCVLGEFAAVAKQLPAAPPVDARGGATEPERVAIDDCAEGDDARDRVAKERGVVVEVNLSRVFIVCTCHRSTVR
jgi:hypothetical protein